MKYIHIGSVVVGLLFPLITVITPMINDAVERNSDDEVFVGTLGFVLTVSPPAHCFGTDGKVTFYSFIIPTIIITEIGAVLLILSIWLFNKVWYCL